MQDQLQKEINTLKAQLQESKQGLIAASRLSEQLERSKQQVSTMKDEGKLFLYIFFIKVFIFEFCNLILHLSFKN